MTPISERTAEQLVRPIAECMGLEGKTVSNWTRNELYLYTKYEHETSFAPHTSPADRERVMLWINEKYGLTGLWEVMRLWSQHRLVNRKPGRAFCESFVAWIESCRAATNAETQTCPECGQSGSRCGCTFETEQPHD